MLLWVHRGILFNCRKWKLFNSANDFPFLKVSDFVWLLTGHVLFIDYSCTIKICEQGVLVRGQSATGEGKVCALSKWKVIVPTSKELAMNQ